MLVYRKALCRPHTSQKNEKLEKKVKEQSSIDIVLEKVCDKFCCQILHICQYLWVFTFLAYAFPSVDMSSIYTMSFIVCLYSLDRIESKIWDCMLVPHTRYTYSVKVAMWPFDSEKLATPALNQFSCCGFTFLWNALPCYSISLICIMSLWLRLHPIVLASLVHELSNLSNHFMCACTV